MEPIMTKIIQQLLVLFVLIHFGLSVQIIDSFSRDINSYISQGRGEGVGRQLEPAWQLPDIVTDIDRVVQYKLGLQKHIGKYQITEIDKPELPKWLTYNAETDSLEGIPSAGDLGRYHISISSEKNPTSKHYFIITVKESSSLEMPSPLSQVQTLKYHCRKDDPLTMASVIIDADPETLSQSDKVSLANKFAAHLNLTVSSVRLVALGGRPAYDATALVAGPGNSRSQKYPGILVSWQIGCGTVDADSMSILEIVESSSITGKLSSAIGFPIVGWHVTNNRPQVQVLKRRRKRQVYATAALEKTPPTDEARDMNRVVPSQATPGHDYMKTHRVKPTRRLYSPVQTLMITPSKPIMLVTEIIPTPSKQTLMTPMVEIPTEQVSVNPTIMKVQPTPATPTKPLPSTPRVIDINPTDEKEIHPTKTDIDVKNTDDIPQIFPDVDLNSAPTVDKEIGRITAHIGRVLHYKIPHNVFYDAEDGDTRNLRLLVLERGTNLPRSSWVRFNQKEQLLYGLPMLKDEDRRVYGYSLAAVDSGGKIRRMQFEIVVKRARKYYKRPPSHEFVLVLAESYDKFIADVDNSISIVQKIAQVYGDKNASSILVRSIKSGSVHFAWTNTTLRKNPCPAKAIMGLMNYIIRDNDTLNPQLVEIMKPFKIKSALARSLGSCSDVAFVPGKPTEKPVEKPSRGNGMEEIANLNQKFMINVVIPIAVMGFFIIVATIVACVLYHTRRKGKLSTNDKQTYANKGIPVIFADEIDDKPDPPTKPLILQEERPPQPPPQYHSMPRSTPRKHLPPPMYNSVEMRRLVDHDEQQRDNSPPYQPPPPITAPNGSRNAKPRSNAHKQKPFYVPP
ncbi:dystroglycan 1-like [Tubulanus polymorphus]|uniref:dystroglycan 1-like n=1 Tax=Tubulanus polymorphus TaxID=672921 RepID=UPI003DA67A96